MSIVTGNKQTKLTNKLMEDITDLLNAYFIQIGVSTMPTIGIIAKVDNDRLGVKEMVEVVNTTIDRAIYPSGLTTRTRKRELLIKRQVVAYISRQLGYPIEHIGRGLYIDHATVLHSSRTVEELLLTKDVDMIEAYNTIIETLNVYHKEKYGKDLPEIVKGRNNS